MTRPETTLTIVEDRKHEVARKLEYRKRSDGQVERVEHEWRVDLKRWHYVGSKVLDGIHTEMTRENEPPRTGP